MNATKPLTNAKFCRTKHRNSRSTSHREGATLLEVLLATALFAIGMAAVMPLLHNGSRAALRGELEALAANRCESAMAMYLTGSGDKSRAVQDSDWHIKIKTRRHDAGMFQVSVTAIWRAAPQAGQFELVRLIPDDSLPRRSQASIGRKERAG